MFDFGIGATELMLIAVVALIVVGPKDLPRLMRTVGHMVNKIRSLAREFQGHLDEAMRESGLDEVKESVGKVKEYTIADLDAEFEELEKEFREKALPEKASADGDGFSLDEADHDVDDDGGDGDDEEKQDITAQPSSSSVEREKAGDSGAERRQPEVISLDEDAGAAVSSQGATQGAVRRENPGAKDDANEQGRGRQGS